ncbi:MAG: TetR family transcriptional regulator [Tetrasphaera sp.]
MRSDARRNRECLLATARDVFAERGPDASLDQIAKRAGVGVGTLYRHFPTREALLQEAYRDAVVELAARGASAADTLTPKEAVRAWLALLVEHMRERKALSTAVVAAMGQDHDVFAESHAPLYDVGIRILAGGVEAGVVRQDVDERDLLWLAHGISQATDGTGDAKRADRLLDVVLQGLWT